MQNLNGRLEHFDEFKQCLRRAIKPAAVAVGIRVVLAEMFQLANVELARERRDILIVLVTGFGFSDADLA